MFSLDFYTLIAYIILTTMRSTTMSRDYMLNDSWQDDPCDDCTHWLLTLRDQRKALEVLEASNNE